MKRTLLYAGVVIVLGGWLGTMMMRDPGYVLIAYGGATLQTSLWFALLFCVVLAFLSIWLMRLIRFLIASNEHFGLWRSDQRKGKARRLTTTGLINLVEGNWQRARRYLSAAAGQSEMPLINYLGAARAAHELGSYEERDRFLRAANELLPEAELAVGITQAQLQYSKGQLEQSLATLKRLPDEPYVLRLLTRVLVELKEWHSLWKLLPVLRKKKPETDEAIDAIEMTVAANLMKEMLAEEEDSSVERHAAARELWRSLTRQARRSPELIGLYARCLHNAGARPEADKMLIGALKATWNDDLIDLFGALPADDPALRLHLAEPLLRKNAYNARLKLCLGRLALAAGETEKSKEYLRGSLAIAESEEVLRALGDLLGREGALSESNQMLARALDLSVERLSHNGESDDDLRAVPMPMI